MSACASSSTPAASCGRRAASNVRDRRTRFRARSESARAARPQRDRFVHLRERFLDQAHGQQGLRLCGVSGGERHAARARSEDVDGIAEHPAALFEGAEIAQQFGHTRIARRDEGGPAGGARALGRDVEALGRELGIAQVEGGRPGADHARHFEVHHAEGLRLRLLACLYTATAP